MVDSIIENAARFGPANSNLAIKYIDSSLGNKKLNVKEQVKVYGHKCRVYLFYLKNPVQAGLYADSMLTLVEANNKEKYPTQYAYANYSKGDVLFRQAKYNEAYTYYYNARSIGKANFNSCTLTEYSYRIGMILYRQSRFSDAAENFQRAYVEATTCNMDFEKYFKMQELLNNTALCFYKLGKADSALIFYDKALRFIDDNKARFANRATLHEVAKAVIYGNQGQILKEQGKFAEAKELFRKSISINSQKGYEKGDALLTYLKLADLFLKERKIDSMGKALLDIRQSLDSIDNKQAEIEWSRLMWQYYDNKKETVDAYKYLMLFNAHNDSLQKANKALNNIDAGQQVRILEKQHDIDVLKKENDLKEGYLILAVCIAVMIIIIGLLIWQNSRRSKKNVKELQYLNNQVNFQKLQLEKTLALLEERNTEKDRILKVVAHDLRTPVASISMLTDLMLEGGSETDKKEMLLLTKTASQNSLALIAEILEATATVKVHISKEKTGINSLITECAELLQLKAKEKNQQIVVQLMREEILMHLSKEKIKRVINNLVTNAIKFSNYDSVIRIKATAKNNTVRIAIKDEGIGIPDNMKSKVFDVFTDARREGTSGEKPFGLGLSICRQIIEAHDGNIWFKSEQGKGTTFYIELKN